MLVCNWVFGNKSCLQEVLQYSATPASIVVVQGHGQLMLP
jgi:hypothetical protein